MRCSLSYQALSIPGQRFNPYTNMNLFSSIGSQLVRLGQRIMGRPLTTTSQLFPISTSEVYPNIDSKNAVINGFEANISVYVVVKKDAVKFGSIPRYVYDATKKEEKARRRHPVLENKAYTPAAPSKLTDLLNRPNPYQSQDAFYTLLRAYYKVSGEGFVWLNRGDLEPYRNDDGSFDDKAIDRLPVLEMYVLPSYLVTVIPDPSNLWGLLGYVLEVPERAVMRRGDVIHWKDINLGFDASSRGQLRGMTALQPGTKTVAESNSLSKSSMRTAQNDGAKGALFNETMDSMSVTQQSDVKKVIDAKINNNDVAGSVTALQGKWGYLDLAMSSKDMEMIEKKKMSWQEIALLFDLPPEFVVTDQKYDNMGQAILQWTTNCVIPACKQLDGEFNRVLPKAFGLEGRVFIGTDYYELPEIRQAMIESAKVMQDIWSISPNDVRQYIGFEPYDDERFNEPWVPSGRAPLSDLQNADDEMAREIEINRLNYERGGDA